MKSSEQCYWFILYLGTKCIIIYLVSTKKLRPPPHPPSPKDDTFLNSHSQATGKRRQVTSLKVSHLFHCYTSVSDISIKKAHWWACVFILKAKVTAGSQLKLTSHVSAKRLTATLLSPMTMAKKEFRFLYSLQLKHKRHMAEKNATLSAI